MIADITHYLYHYFISYWETGIGNYFLVLIIIACFAIEKPYEGFTTVSY